MDRNDQQAIGNLFEKLANVERQTPPRDAEAERFINDRIARQPGAPYYMAQTIVVQEQALNAAQSRIEELEQQAQQSAGGGLLGGLFGGGARRSGSVPRVGRTAAAAPQEPLSGNDQQRAGGGFLAGAAQTAMGVAGGVLLGNAIAGMFGGSEAQATEPAASQPDEAAADQAGDASSDGGGDFGDIEF
ncbi:DUF2076 domain-containing protein [Mesorhizobium onobrychidis]|uniref:DUF2076 domain-containing protein n=1 Tax=Mesorhizobium onobrychidis TaxID=2775404 RepID=A0ABY5QRM9_9HYPH|nr:DUF2076 domain-containing protein [Mesorhizobium onobrychidis]UVC13391.1 DUF2076 domain-containing protein [Mesorhizobium onobrychidis]